MSEPLHLKYRPQKLAELVGQEVISRVLTNAISLNKIAHAYFFTGPRGCGKTSTARILARSLNCVEGPTQDPCGVCTNCQEISMGVSPDVIEIDAASHRSVEDAALVIQRCHLAPQTAKHKIYIFDEVHMLSKEAFNALLKTIEEPPPNVVFILATTEEHKVPSTIVSRCQRFAFRLIERNALVEHLQNVAQKECINLTTQAIERVAKQSGGGLRDALSLLDQVSILATEQTPLDEPEILTLLGAISDESLNSLLQCLQEQNSENTLQKIDDFMQRGVDPLQLCRSLIEFAVARLESTLLPSEANPETNSGTKAKSLISVIASLNELEFGLRNAAQPILKIKTALLQVALGYGPSAAKDEQINSLKLQIVRLEEQIQGFTTSSQPSTFIKKAAIQSEVPVKNLFNEGSQSTSAVIEDFASSHSAQQPEKPHPTMANQQHSVSGNLMDKIIANLKHVPTKAAIQGGKVFVLKQEADLITFGVPSKSFLDKLNDAKKIKLLEEALSLLSVNSRVAFELAERSEQQTEASNNEALNISQSASGQSHLQEEVTHENDVNEDTFETNHQINNVDKQNTSLGEDNKVVKAASNELHSNALHILGAKVIDESTKEAAGKQERKTS